MATTLRDQVAEAIKRKHNQGFDAMAQAAMDVVSEELKSPSILSAMQFAYCDASSDGGVELEAIENVQTVAARKVKGDA